MADRTPLQNLLLLVKRGESSGDSAGGVMRVVKDIQG